MTQALAFISFYFTCTAGFSTGLDHAPNPLVLTVNSISLDALDGQYGYVYVSKGLLTNS